MPRIFIIDVTNRDGVQTARIGLANLELAEMGILSPIRLEGWAPKHFNR